MAKTFTQINIHAVYTVRFRDAFLTEKIRPELFKYTAGIINASGHYSLAVNGWKDHVHIFFELNPTISLSKAMQTIKANSSKWMNERKFFPIKFEWQEGYGAFSYSRAQRDDIIKYITSQEQHHQYHTFREEYLDMLEKFEIEHIGKKIFEFFD
jgi:putative transposase